MNTLYLSLLILASTLFSHDNACEEEMANWIITPSTENNHLYHEKAGIYDGAEVQLISTNSVAKSIEERPKFDAHQVIHYTEGSRGEKMELGYLKAGEEVYAYQSAYVPDDSNCKRMYEYIVKVADAEIPTDLIEKKRKEWEKHSNNHDPQSLIEKVYTDDAIYFNNGNIDLGSDIIERYSYMNNPKWKIRLENHGLIPVSKKEVLEIGHYYSGGKGQYLLVWKKGNSGEWKVALDFNF